MTYTIEHWVAILLTLTWLCGMVVGYAIRWTQEGWRKPPQIVNEDYGYPFYRRPK